MSDDLEQTLATIAKFAATQRQRVSTVTVDGVSFTLAPLELAPLEPAPSQPIDPKKPVVDGPIAPLNDPASYGWPEGTEPPGFKDPRKGKTS